MTVERDLLWIVPGAGYAAFIAVLAVVSLLRPDTEERSGDEPADDPTWGYGGF